MRSFRAETLSEFVKLVLDLEQDSARTVFQHLRARYPIVLTRSVAKAKRWLREQAQGVRAIRDGGFFSGFAS